MVELFSRPKIPQPPPPAPLPPPAPGAGDNQVKTRLRPKQGDRANLMTGGMGLKEIPAANLLSTTLGGYTPMGQANG